MNNKYYFSDFVQGKGEPPPVIDDAICRRLVQRSVAAIFSHLGFDSKIIYTPEHCSIFTTISVIIAKNNCILTPEHCSIFTTIS